MTSASLPTPPRAARGRTTIACAIVVALFAADSRANDALPAVGATLWLRDSGLPAGDVLAMAQDEEGYLWLGMNTGLVRFDGRQFVPWGSRGEPALPGTSVQAIAATRDGSLWTGYDNGGLARIRGGHVDVIAAGSSGLPSGRVSALIEDRAGALWVGTAQGLARYEGGAWRSFDEGQLSGAEVFSVYEDRAGAIWIGTSAGVFRRRAGSAAFERAAGDFRFVQSLAEDSHGSIWITDSQQVMRRLRDAVMPEYEAAIRLPTAGWRLLSGNDGTIWVAALGGGLLRFAHRRDGLPAVHRVNDGGKIVGSPRALFQDRAGQIWVGMRGGGLVRVSASVFDTSTPLEGLTNDGVRGLAAAANGDVWVATGYHLNRFNEGTRRVYDVAQTVALHVDREDSLWAATALGVGRLSEDRIDPLPVAPGIRSERVVSLTTDPAGRLWLCSVDQGLLSNDGGMISRYEKDGALLGRPCYFVFSDSSGRLWVGLRDAVGVLVADRFEVHGAGAGIPPGAIIAITEDSTGAIWFGNSSSLTRFRNGRFTSVGAPNGLPGTIVPALVDDERGRLWIGVNVGSEIVRLNHREIDRSVVDAAHQLNYALYDQTDGLRGELHWFSRPGAVRASDGRLWFSTGGGVAIVDPSRPATNHDRTLLRVERAIVADRSLTAEPQLSLPYAAPLQIEYDAISLSAGSKLRFRYLLDGFDDVWVNAGTAREATYRDLPPGNYRFRVAATGAGEWSDTEAVWAFLVMPPFYHTPGFYAAAAAGVALLVWGYWQMRLRAVRRQFAMVVAERTRVSREIHDTLLQSLGAVTLELEAVAREVEAERHGSGDALRRLRRRLVSCVREARHSVWDLRSPLLDARALEESLSVLTNGIASSGDIEATFAVTGTLPECGHDVAHNLLRIAQEAAHNAVQHGAPRRVRIDLERSPDSLTLSVSDDGVGFDVSSRTADPAADHFGLVNMQERAARIGGDLEVVSRPGAGTVVKATIPLER